MSDYPLGLQGRPFPYHVNTTADHWWPKGLQRLWTDPDGYVSCIKPSTEVDRRRPAKKGSKKGFAQKRGGHKMVFGISPWNHTFEPEFNEVDSNGPPIIRRIAKKLIGEDQDLFNPQSAASTADILVKLCFSLLIRSPAFRERYSHAGKSFGMGYDEETGKANISHFWRSAKSIDLTKCNSGNLLLLHSNNAEFCFGDGLYDTIFTRPLGWRPQGIHWIADLIGDAFVPLLPDLCAYLYFKRDSCGSNIHVLRVSSDSVAEVNALTQIYSKEQLFFRTFPPALIQEYKRNEHLMIARGPIPLITALRARVV